MKIVNQQEQMRLMSSEGHIVILLSMNSTGIKNPFDTNIILVSFPIPKIQEKLN